MLPLDFKKQLHVHIHIKENEKLKKDAFEVINSSTDGRGERVERRAGCREAIMKRNFPFLIYKLLHHLNF